MSYGRGMTTNDLTGPNPETIIDYIRRTYPESDILESGGTWFFSFDPERHFPNYATIVTNNDYDDGSDLDREGVFRLNLGLTRATFERLVGDKLDAASPPDYTALDTLLPHPTYASQLWVSILNPSKSTFRDVVVPLIAEAHDRLAQQRARHGLG
jgi:Family of unknown function (DUF6194)